MIRLGPSDASCHVLVCREGLLSSFGHDLELAVTSFDIRVDEVQRTVVATFGAASLRAVRGSMTRPTRRTACLTGTARRSRTRCATTCSRRIAIPR
jgi:hypothetical protein